MSDGSGELRYEEILPKSRAELITAFASGNEKSICDALYSAAQHEPDWRWAQDQILEFLDHRSLAVRCAALQSLGELAMFRQVIDHEKVVPRVYALLRDPALRATAEETLSDITDCVKTQ